MVDLSRFLDDFIAQIEREPEPDRSASAPPDYVRGIHRKLRWIETAGRMPATREQLTVDDARRDLETAINEYLSIDDPDRGYATHLLLVKALPGLGKTTLAVRAAERLGSQGRRVMYCGPRHNFFGDVMQIAERQALWYEWLPRQKGERETCAYADEINEWLHKGYEAIDFCRGVCGWTWINEACAYYAQKSRPEPIIFCQHQHVVLGHPLTFSYVFGDESPVMAFQHDWRIPAEFVLPRGMDVTEPLAELLHRLSTLALGDHLHGEELLLALGGKDYVLAAIEDANVPLDADFVQPEIREAKAVRDAPYAHLFALAGLLRREASADRPGVHRVIAGHGAVRLLMRHAPNDKLPPHIVWCDATANERLYRACFGRPVELVDAQPEMQGRIYQLYERANTKTTLASRNRPPEGETWAEQDSEITDKTTQAVQVIRKIAARYHDPMVISFQQVLNQTELKDLRHVHFYAARGTNLFEDADAAIILGTPQPSIYDLEKAAAMIFFERDEAFRSQWTTAERAFRYVSDDGQAAAYPVSGFWGDPDLQAVLWSLREAEIIQAAHRCRPVNHSVDIWLLTNLPIDELPPGELLTMRDVLGSPEGVGIFDWERIVAATEEIAASTGAVTVADMMATLGVGRNAASKYLKLIVENEEGWFVESIRGENPLGGSPKKSIRRRGVMHSQQYIL